MSSAKQKGPIYDPGLCRCCATMKKCRLLNVEYDSWGTKEVYSTMMLECFGVMLSNLDGKPTDRLVCATCVTRLRDAFNFRKQVMMCEEAYIHMRVKDEVDSLDVEAPLVEGAPPPYPLEVTVVKSELDEDYRDNSCDSELPADDAIETILLESCMNECSDSNDDLPLKSLAMNKLQNRVEISIPAEPEAATLAEPEAVTPAEPEAEAPAPAHAQGPIENHQFWVRQRQPTQKPKVPIATMQERVRQRDHSFMVETNVFAIVENSYICPFKCRHNNLLCYYCGTHYVDPETLREHTESQHHPKKFKVHDHKNMIKFDVTRLDCRLCPAKIDDLDTFKKHIVDVHGKRFYSECTDSVLPFKLVKDDMRCAVCDAAFPYFHALNKHMNEHFSNYVCETCGLGFVDNNRFVMHQARHEQGSYPCETCGKLFKSEYNRELHIDRVHNKRGRVYCPKCDVKLMSHPQKLKHLVEVHGETPTCLPCTYCDKTFDTRRNLTIHWRKDHLKDYRYDCHVCGQKFFTRFALNNHMPTHTGERNFKCKVCDKSYPRLKTLKEHTRIHNNDRRYRYDCHVCGQKFFTRFALNNHMPTHTGERNFKCKVCDKSYPRLKTLKEHTRIHNNDRRYRCHICGVAFIQNCSLKGHMKSQHPDY